MFFFKVNKLLGKKVQVDFGARSYFYFNISEFIRFGISISRGSSFCLPDFCCRSFSSLRDIFFKMSHSVLKDSYFKGTFVSGVISNKVKGGYSVSVNGVFCFLPNSLVSPSFVRNFDYSRYIGKSYYFCVIKYSEGNIVVSRRKFLERLRLRRINRFFSNVRLGDCFYGIVKAIVNYGYFVNIRGIVDALLHKSNIFGSSFSFSLGSRILVSVIFIDRENKKISLSFSNRVIVFKGNIRFLFSHISYSYVVVILFGRYKGLISVYNISWVNYFNYFYNFKSYTVGFFVCFKSFVYLNYIYNIFNPWFSFNSFFLNYRKCNVLFFKKVGSIYVYKLPFFVIGFSYYKKVLFNNAYFFFNGRVVVLY